MVLAGSVPLGLDDDCYARMIQKLRPLGVKIFFYTYGDPLRLGIKARPDFIFPKLVEAEKVIGYEFTSMEDRILAARRMREMGAGSVVITFRFGCVARPGDRRLLPHVHRQDARCGHALAHWAGATLSWAATRSSSWTGRRRSSACASGLGCAAANLIRYGAGVFSPADAERLAKRVEIEEVSAE